MASACSPYTRSGLISVFFLRSRPRASEDVRLKLSAQHPLAVPYFIPNTPPRTSTDLLEGPQYKTHGPPSCSSLLGLLPVGICSWFDLWNQYTMWKPTTVFPVPVERGQCDFLWPHLPTQGSPSWLLQMGPTWWALDDCELLLQSAPDGPVLALVQLMMSTRDVVVLPLQEPAGRCWGGGCECSRSQGSFEHQALGKKWKRGRPTLVERTLVRPAAATGLRDCTAGLRDWATELRYWATGPRYWAMGLRYWATGPRYWVGYWATGLRDRQAQGDTNDQWGCRFQLTHSFFLAAEG